MFPHLDWEKAPKGFQTIYVGNIAERLKKTLHTNIQSYMYLRFNYALVGPEHFRKIFNVVISVCPGDALDTSVDLLSTQCSGSMLF